MKLPKYTIWWELKSPYLMGEKEKEHFIKLEPVQHKSCLQMLWNLDGEKKVLSSFD